MSRSENFNQGRDDSSPINIQLSFHPHDPAVNTQFRPYHEVRAHVDGKQVGHLMWHPTGTISDVEVEGPYRRRGIATRMWKYANQMAAQHGLDLPEHDEARTDSGDAWARAVGGYLPERVINE